MKKLLLVLALAFSSIAAHAGVVNEIFFDTSGKMFSLNEVREVKFYSTYVDLTYTDGSSSYSYLSDANGVIADKIKRSGAFQAFVRVGDMTSNRFIRPAYAKYMTCQGGYTVIGWYKTGSEYIQDNCQVIDNARNISN